jgi:hypothetical protein
MGISSKVVRAGLHSPLQAAHQISMTFDTVELRGMSAPQRAKALAHLANLLMLAAGAKERDDDER